MSIHKSQGQTLNYVKVDLGKVFECGSSLPLPAEFSETLLTLECQYTGQSYVALSRATSLDSLQVINFKASRVKPHDKVAEWSVSVISTCKSCLGSCSRAETPRSPQTLKRSAKQAQHDKLQLISSRILK